MVVHFLITNPDAIPQKSILLKSSLIKCSIPFENCTLSESSKIITHFVC